MSDATKRAASPEDLSRLFVELGNAGDADGLADLYEPDAVMAYPPGRETVGTLTSTRSADGQGSRVQVARRQADGSWLRVIDRPELPEDAR